MNDPWQRLRNWLTGDGSVSCDIYYHCVTLRRHGSAVPVVAELIAMAHARPDWQAGDTDVYTKYLWCGRPKEEGGDATLDEVLTAALDHWGIP